MDLKTKFMNIYNSNILSRRIKYNLDNTLHAVYNTDFLTKKNKITNISQVIDSGSPFKNTITITTQNPHNLVNLNKRDFIITGIEFVVDIDTIEITKNYNLRVKTIGNMYFANAGVSNIRLSGFDDSKLNQEYTIHLKNTESLQSILLIPKKSIKDALLTATNPKMMVTTFKRVFDYKNEPQTGINRQLNESEITIISPTQFSYEIDYLDYNGVLQTPPNAYIGFSNIVVYHANTEITKLEPVNENHIIIYLPTITPQNNPAESIGYYSQDQSRQKQSVEIDVYYAITDQEKHTNLNKIDKASDVLFFIEKILFANGINLNSENDIVIKNSMAVDSQTVDYFNSGFVGWSASFSFMVLKTWDIKLLDSTDSPYRQLQGEVKYNGEELDKLTTPIINT